jgi:hypothetical protein
VAASDYTWVTFNARTGARIAELPLTGVRYSDALDKAATMTGSVALNTRDMLGVDITAATERGKTGIYADRGGVPVWAGFIWDREYDSESETLTLDCATWWSYWSHRLTTTSRNFVATDQLTIARTLIADGVGFANPMLSIPAAPTSGVLRDRQYFYYDKRPLAELVQQLAAVDNGFDFSIDPSYVAGDLVLTLNWYYPRRGRTQANSGHIFEYGADTLGNIVKYSWPDPGSQEANQVWNLGAGNGDTMLKAAYFDPTRTDAGWPLLESVISNKDVTVLATLQAQALAELRAKANISGVPKMTVLADVEPQFGGWTLGDDVRIRIADYRFPRNADGSVSLDVWRRISGYTVNVPDDGSPETVDLELILAQ